MFQAIASFFSAIGTGFIFVGFMALAVGLALVLFFGFESQRLQRATLIDISWKFAVAIAAIMMAAVGSLLSAAGGAQPNPHFIEYCRLLIFGLLAPIVLAAFAFVLASTRKLQPNLTVATWQSPEQLLADHKALFELEKLKTDTEEPEAGNIAFGASVISFLFVCIFGLSGMARHAEWRPDPVAPPPSSNGSDTSVDVNVFVGRDAVVHCPELGMRLRKPIVGVADAPDGVGPVGQTPGEGVDSQPGAIEQPQGRVCAPRRRAN